MNQTHCRRQHLIRTLLAGGLLVLAVPAVSSAQSAPDRNRTLDYNAETRRWVEIPPPQPGTAEGDLFHIRAQIKDEDYGDALESCDGFAQAYGEGDLLYPAVMIAKAEALIGKRRYYKAHELLQKFLNRYGGLELTGEALRLEFIIAETYLSGVRRKFLGMRVLASEDTAMSILDDISIGFPQDKLAPLAIKTKADYYFRKGEHAQAELAYSRLLQEYPNNRYHQLALKRSAESALASFRGIEYDEAALIEADARFRDYRLQYPQEAGQEGIGVILQEIRSYRAEKDFTIATYYERTGHLRSAVFYYSSVVREWPESAAAIKARAKLETLGQLPADAADGAGSAPTATGQQHGGADEAVRLEDLMLPSADDPNHASDHPATKDEPEDSAR